MNILRVIIFWQLMFAPVIFGQTIPNTEIYLLKHDAGVWGTPQNITNRVGYDNQPHFTPDGKSLLYTSMREGQTDIFYYDIESAEHRRLTRTMESEYSPTPTPDGVHFSVVRVEKDSLQRLWQFGWRSETPELIFPEIKPVGYHVWASDSKIALFVLGEPHELHIADTKTRTSEIVAKSIGRCLQKIPGKPAFSFVDKSNEGGWWISQFDVVASKISPIVKTMPEKEDYVWIATNEPFLLMGNGAELFSVALNESNEAWQIFADFKKSGLENITRIAVSPNGKWIAVVDAR